MILKSNRNGKHEFSHAALRLFIVRFTLVFDRFTFTSPNPFIQGTSCHPWHIVIFGSPCFLLDTRSPFVSIMQNKVVPFVPKMLADVAETEIVVEDYHLPLTENDDVQTTISGNATT